MTRLCEIYTAILEGLGYTVNEEGLVSQVLSKGALRPLTVKDGDSDERLRLATPTADRLKTGDWNGLIAFHPLSEDTMRGESEIITLMRKRAQQMVNARLNILIAELVRIAGDAELLTKLSPQQLAITNIMPKADKRLSDDIQSVLGSLNGKDKTLCNIYINRGGEVGGKKYNRAFICNVNFKTDDERKIYGTQFRVADADIPEKLMEYILPKHAEEGYSVGSASNVAPYLLAFLRGFSKIIKRLNDVYELYENLLDPVFEKALKIPLDWIEMVDEVLEHQHDIPPLRGNTGLSDTTKVEAEHDPSAIVAGMDDELDVSVSNAVAKAPANVAAPAPAQLAPKQETPATSKDNTVTLAEINAARNANAAPAYAQPPHNAYGHQPHMQAGYQYQPHQPQVPIARTPREEALQRQTQVPYSPYGTPVHQTAPPSYAPAPHTQAPMPQQFDHLGRPIAVPVHTPGYNGGYGAITKV